MWWHWALVAVCARWCWALICWRRWRHVVVLGVAVHACWVLVAVRACWALVAVRTCWCWAFVSVMFVFRSLVVRGGLAGRLWLWVSSSACCGWCWGAVTVRGGGCWGAVVAVYGCWWAWGAVVILGSDRGVLLALVGCCGGSSTLVVSLCWCVGLVGCPGRLWLLVGMVGGRHVWLSVGWVRMGRLGWRCSPMDNDERRTVVVRRLGATSTSAMWHRLKRMGVGTYLGWRRRVSSPSGDGGWLSSSDGHRHGG